MPDDILSAYKAEELLAIQNSPVAIANPDQKIVWYNQSFKSNFDTGRIKGSSIFNLFSLEESILPTETKTGKPLVVPLTGSNVNVTITPIYSKKKKNKLQGYYVELNPVKQNGNGFENISEHVERNISFLEELENLFVLLVKENSLKVISEQIISKATELSNSDFGLVVYQEEGNKYEFSFHDPKSLIYDKAGSEKSISSDFAFISKWLRLNKKALLALNQQNNIGFNLTGILNCKSLIISPCFFEDNLLATIIVGKRNSVHSAFEKNIVEQLSPLLSFAISSLKTRELNATLENRLLQAQKLETIGKLSSGMAHDFNNLLSSIFGSLNLLRKRVEQTEDTERLIDNIENCSIRARGLTKGLLSFGKPTPKRKELIKPNLLINEISKVVTQTFPRAITFEETVDENLHDILGNGTEIYQVLLNLCVNAKEATDGNGTIKLAAKNISINKNNIINYPLLKEGNYVCFSVQDNGSGIKEEDLQRIFDPYFSTKSKDTGSGLGLYVTYGIIKAHNGMIDVTSTVKAGTRFDVFIPSYEPLKEKKRQEQETKDKIILLADDEEMLSDLLAELLESSNYNVIKVPSGVEAIKLLTEEIKVDLAIIDYHMPGMDGLATIEEIRKLNFEMPVILSSGTMDASEGQKFDKLNINSIVEKPYEFETMLSTIQKLI